MRFDVPWIEVMFVGGNLCIRSKELNFSCVLTGVFYKKKKTTKTIGF